MAVADFSGGTHMIYNEGRQLVSGETRDSPRGKGNAVDGADILHAVMVGQQRGYVAEAAAVAGVHYKQQDQYQNHQYGALSHVCDTLGQDHQSGCDNGEDNHNLVNRVSVLHGVSPRGEAQPSAGVKYCRYGSEDTCHPCKTDTLNDHFLLGDQGEAAGDIDIKHQPDANEHNRLGLDDVDCPCAFFLGSGLVPASGLGQKQMTHEHHDKIYRSQDQEHLVDAALTQGIQHGLHNGAGDGLGSAEARNRESGSQTLAILEPEHQRLYRGEITGSQTDTHDKAVADIDADQGKRAALVGAAVPDKEAGACHTCSEADGCNQGRAVNILFHHISQKGGGHTEEENGKAECPLGSALGKADILGNLLTEDGPAVHGADTAVEEKCGNGRTNPFVLYFHK